MGSRTPHPRRAFTLVELLVVIAIIALLIAMLLPALNNVRQQAKNVACASNQRQLALGVQMYVNASGGWLPHNDMWSAKLYTPAGQWTNLGYSWEAHYTGLGRLYQLNYVKSAAVFWCASEDVPNIKAGSQSQYGMKKLVGPSPSQTETDYWYRCGTGGHPSSVTNWPGQPSVRINHLRRPEDGLLMCAGWWGGGNQPDWIRWTQLHRARGFNLAFIDGSVQWMDYKLYPKFPSTGFGQNGQTGTPSDSYGNRYRPDMGTATLNRATRVYHGAWKYP